MGDIPKSCDNDAGTSCLTSDHAGLMPGALGQETGIWDGWFRHTRKVYVPPGWEYCIKLDDSNEQGVHFYASRGWIHCYSHPGVPSNNITHARVAQFYTDSTGWRNPDCWDCWGGGIRTRKDCNYHIWDRGCVGSVNDQKYIGNCNKGTSCYNAKIRHCAGQNLAHNSTCYKLCEEDKEKCPTAISNFCNFDNRTYGICDGLRADLLNSGCNFSNKHLQDCRSVNSRLENILALNCKTSNFNDGDCITWCSNKPNECAGAFEAFCAGNPEQKICTDYLDANTNATSSGASLEKSITVVKNYCNTVDKIDRPFCKKYLSTVALRGKSDDIVNNYCNIKSNKLSNFCSCINSEQINEYWKDIDNKYLLSKAISRPDCVYPKCLDKITEAYKKDYQSPCAGDTICNITVNQLKQFNQCKDNIGANVECNSTINLVNSCGNDSVNMTKIPQQAGQQAGQQTNSGNNSNTNSNGGVTINIDVNNISTQINNLLKTPYGIYVIAGVIIVFLLFVFR